MFCRRFAFAEFRGAEWIRCGAGHASTSGKLEDHHLFYLMARGIPLAEARRLVIRGFFGELIGRIGVPELRDRIAESIEAELAADAGGQQP